MPVVKLVEPTASLPLLPKSSSAGTNVCQTDFTSSTEEQIVSITNWQPASKQRRNPFFWNAVSALAVGTLVCGLRAAAHPVGASVDQASFAALLLRLLLNPMDWAGGMLLLQVCAVLHVSLGWAAFRGMGARPIRKGATMLAAPGTWLTRRQYLAVIAVPPAAICLTGLLLAIISPDVIDLRHIPIPLYPAGCLIWALAWYVLGCGNNLRSFILVQRLPRTALIEDVKEGFRYRVP